MIPARAAGWVRGPSVMAVVAALAGVLAGYLGIQSAQSSILATLVTLVLLALAALLVLGHPFLGVVFVAGVAALLPFAVVPIRLVVAPTFVDVALGLLLLGWTLPLVHHDGRLLLSGRHGLLLLFLGSSAVSYFVGSSYAPVSGEDTRLYLKLLASALLCVSVAQVVRTETQLNVLLRVLIIASAAGAGVALAIYPLPTETAVTVLSSLGDLGYPTGPDVVRTVAGTDTVRATGTSVDPNVLGGLLTIGTLLAAGQAVASRPALPRAALIGMGMLMLAAAALSYSRSAWVGLGAGLAYLALFKERRLLAVGVLGLVGVGLLPQTQSFISRFAGALELRDPATLQRLGEYQNALALIGQYPIFGIGFGQSPTIETGAGVSSLYLQIAEQTGLVGLALFLATVVVVAVDAFSIKVPRDTSLWGAATGLQAAFVGTLVAGLFDHYFFNVRFPHMVAVFWLLIGLLTTASWLAARAQWEPVPGGEHPTVG